jgi:hypothetical protein
MSAPIKRLIPPLLLVSAAALVFAAGPSFLSTSSAARTTKTRPQWEYAHLVLGDTAADIYWQTGKATVSSAGDVTKPDPSRSIAALYAQLGGQEENPNLGALLNLIGRDGWEMVSYTRPPGVQTWWFKRAKTAEVDRD